jgi:hypothetical protein
MNKLAYRIFRPIRTSLTRLLDRVPSWTSRDTREWNGGLHRRDPWR